MRLTPGTKLGPYEIRAPLGKGGMGEVYRARDSRLGRDVAVKVLPEHLSSDAQALKRFEREARAVAALSHPNILALYDVGSEQGISYVVTELLEGENIRACLTQDSFNRPKAIEVAVDLAEGLSAAHSRGFTHRDLKPENIFLTADGVVKILDFGLAHYMPVSCSQAGDAPTETEMGRVMGTVGYMSPEQIRGEPVDARSDIFSLGCVLYELFSGRRAFAGHSPGDTLAATLREDASPLSDPDIQRVIAHCLEKKPAARFQTVRDLLFVLRSLPATAARRRAPRRGGSSPSNRSPFSPSSTWLATLISTTSATESPRRSPIRFRSSLSFVSCRDPEPSATKTLRLTPCRPDASSASTPSSPVVSLCAAKISTSRWNWSMSPRTPSSGASSSRAALPRFRPFKTRSPAPSP